MATDYAEKERAFILSLAEDTGADLEGWLTAIGGSGLIERNDIIDWLRQQGFAFAKASWIERIHHNGGRLIYGEEPPPAPARVTEPKMAPVMPFAGKPPERQTAAAANVVAMPTPRPKSALRVVPASPADSDVAAVLAAAKGLRPLADVLVREIASHIPGVRTKAEAPLLTFAAPKPFAALLPDPKVLRLYGDFGTGGDVRVKRTDAAGRALVSHPHMIALNDVRQIDEALSALIATAYAAANK